MRDRQPEWSEETFYPPERMSEPRESDDPGGLQPRQGEQSGEHRGPSQQGRSRGLLFGEQQGGQSVRGESESESAEDQLAGLAGGGDVDSEKARARGRRNPDEHEPEQNGIQEVDQQSGHARQCGIGTGRRPDLTVGKAPGLRSPPRKNEKSNALGPIMGELERRKVQGEARIPEITRVASGNEGLSAWTPQSICWIVVSIQFSVGGE